MFFYQNNCETDQRVNAQMNSSESFEVKPNIKKTIIPLYSNYCIGACRERPCPSPRLSAWAAQLRRNVATIASRWRHCVRFDRPGIRTPASCNPAAIAMCSTAELTCRLNSKSCVTSSRSHAYFYSLRIIAFYRDVRNVHVKELTIPRCILNRVAKKLTRDKKKINDAENTKKLTGLAISDESS